MARLAQSVERGTFNPEVKGSSPLSGVDFRMSFRTWTCPYIPTYILFDLGSIQIDFKLEL